jgi:pyridoxamine 5'-phosphate oxidase
MTRRKDTKQAQKRPQQKMSPKEVKGEPKEEVFTSEDPIVLFSEWLAAADKKEINDPGAMSLATVDASGFPNVRMVLLKHADEDGFVFYTNLGSQKSQELAENKVAALCFHWKAIRRQVRVQGLVEPVSDEEADAYFSSRPKDSQIGAWASKQSQTLEGRFELEAAVAKFGAKYALTKVPRPDHWSGFRIRPIRIEFWKDRWYRLHDRIRFHRDSVESQDWHMERLYP